MSPRYQHVGRIPDSNASPSKCEYRSVRTVEHCRGSAPAVSTQSKEPVMHRRFLVVLAIVGVALFAVPRKVTVSRPNFISRVFPTSGWAVILLLVGFPAAARTWLAIMPIFTPPTDCWGTNLLATSGAAPAGSAIVKATVSARRTALLPTRICQSLPRRRIYAPVNRRRCAR